MTRDQSPSVIVIGGGLAGSEAAWQLAERGIPVSLYEMRPHTSTPAHKTDLLAELVCSNSMGSDLPDRAPGMLKQELRRLGSLILRCAADAVVPAGGALAVDRHRFAQGVTAAIANHPLIRIVREQVTTFPSAGIVIVATGPLTSDSLAREIAALAGQDHLYFYDAMAPIVTLESIDLNKVFRASRYGQGEGDYINCPLTRDEYDRFLSALLTAETFPLRQFEQESHRFFEACLPIEVLAARGYQALAFGPLKPAGLRDPRTGLRPFAVVQLRQDNLAGTLYNLVGFQTNLRWPEQKRVFSLIPGLENAEWVRFGQMHRNTFINSPALLQPTLRWRNESQTPGLSLYFAGQMVGTEGYMGSTASGLAAGINAARRFSGRQEVSFPTTTMIGALLHYISASQETPFQPMKANLGLLPPLHPPVPKKRLRYQAFAERSQRDLEAFIAAHSLLDDLSASSSPQGAGEHP